MVAGSRIGKKLGLVAALVAAVAGVVFIVSSTYMAERMGRRVLDATEPALRAEARAALAKATQAQVSRYDGAFARLADGSRAIARMAEQILARPDAYNVPLRPIDLAQARKGYVTTAPDAPVSVLAWPAGEISAAQRERLTRFSHLDPLLQRVRHKSEAAVAAWTLSERQTTRYAADRPLIDAIPPPSDAPPRELIFYRSAAPAANPDQSAAWTRVYRDNTDQGLMVTVGTPFHRPGEGPPSQRFAGVAGVDVTLTGMVEAMVDVRTAADERVPGFSFLVDGQGRLIAVPRDKGALLGLDAAAETAKGDVLGYNLAEAGDKPINSVAQSIAAGEMPGVRSLSLGGDGYMVAAARMDSTGWGYVNLVPQGHVLASLNRARAKIGTSISDMTWQLSLITVLGVLVTVAALLTYIQWSFVNPVRRLADGARRVGAEAETVRLGLKRRDELGEVTQAFDQMAEEVRRQIDTLEARVAERTRELAEQAVTDHLTGLANRRRIQSLLAAEHERSVRHERPLALLMIDVDHFKQVNDSHGHDAGDKVLAAVGGYLQAALRKIDTVGRFGGEELIVILPDTDREHAQQVGERLRAGLPAAVAERLGVSADSELAVTASIGVAASEPPDLLSVEQLLQAADDNAYRAKAAGRNAVAG